MATQQEIDGIKDRYLDALNRVNLLLLREHDLRRDQKLYTQQLTKVDSLIESIQSGRHNSLDLLAQDSHLRDIIRQNQKQLRKLQLKLKGQQIYTQVNQLKEIQKKYLYMISQEFQSSIQQKLSTIRGKVDELKKKIKEINKEILSYEQEHLQGIDEYSLCLTILQDYQESNCKLREEIGRLRVGLARK